MKDETKPAPPPIWIRKKALLQRWAGMPPSTFADRLSRGLIPKPEHPFGPRMPLWRMDTVEAFEASAKQAVA